MSESEKLANIETMDTKKNVKKNKLYSFIMKLDCIRNQQVKRFSQHSFYLGLLVMFVPTFTYFELCVVLPSVIEHWSLAFFCHLGFASFLMVNILGNLYYGMTKNNTVKGRNLDNFNKEEWSFCSICDCVKPPRAWHCEICDICILKRDHHCTFFACCVGYYNHRYFLMFTFYTFVAVTYSFYYNIIFASQFMSWNHGLILAKILCPVAGLLIDYSDESVCVSLIIFHVFGAITAGFMLVYHLNNLRQGRLVPETHLNTENFIHNKGLKLNLIDVFGFRWYLAWLLPFIHSELPGNGIEWPVGDKCKLY